MHFEFLVEDTSGEKALKILVPKILGDRHTSNVHAFKGIGHLPKDMKSSHDINNRHLLNQLPRFLRAYGKTFSKYPADYPAAVILVCDLDNKCPVKFRQELLALLEACHPKPITRFCIAIEEGEAWFLGDLPAIKKAYPKAKDGILNQYINDSICGTWEKLADAVYSGGAKALSAKGWRTIGKEKSAWAVKICPHMNVKKNSSPSFIYFKTQLCNLAEAAT